MSSISTAERITMAHFGSPKPRAPLSSGSVVSDPDKADGVPRRILVVDDNPAIHADFRKLLCPEPRNTALDAMESSLFGSVAGSVRNSFLVDTALQGREAVALVQRSVRTSTRYALAFVDMRMPPGWDGVDTIAHMWSVDPDIEVVICSAYCDYSWNDIMRRLNRPDRVHLLIKPFSSKDALEYAWSLTGGWLKRRGLERAG
jgi:CheY-like chemotaxis protein